MDQFDVLRVHIGLPGSTNDSAAVLNINEGGLGVSFGGSNGGGASYAVHFKAKAFLRADIADTSLTGLMANACLRDAIERALAGTLTRSTEQLLAVAGGGGGAGRNGAGGCAGFTGAFLGPSGLAYGQSTIGAGPYGSVAGEPFVQPSLLGLSAAPFVVGPNPLFDGLSGGGGTLTCGGQSSVSTDSNGQKLVPFASAYDAGGTVTTDSGTGGGGGGGGLYGGGAGGWNGLSKPNNFHCGGGGGASMAMSNRASEDQSTLNLYLDPGASIDRTFFTGSYMVLGLANT
jgi:hypothetical protein